MCDFYKQFFSTKLQEMSWKFVVRRLCQWIFYYKYLFSKQEWPIEQSISWEGNSLSANQERKKNLIQTVEKLFWKLMLLGKIKVMGSGFSSSTQEKIPVSNAKVYTLPV
jgi:hypothetical protein